MGCRPFQPLYPFGAYHAFPPLLPAEHYEKQKRCHDHRRDEGHANNPLPIVFIHFRHHFQGLVVDLLSFGGRHFTAVQALFHSGRCLGDDLNGIGPDFVRGPLYVRGRVFDCCMQGAQSFDQFVVAFQPVHFLLVQQI